MGEKLTQFYTKVKEVGGIKAQMRLALITKMSKKKASQEPDSPENIRVFEKAMAEIEKEFK